MIFSPSIEAIYCDSGIDFYESIARIARLGFETFEFWSWWDKDIHAIQRRTEEFGLTVGSFCTKMIPLVNPMRRKEYITGLEESIAVATKLGCKHLITQVGDEQIGLSRWEQKQSIVQGLKECVPLLQERGITLLVEPLNTKVDHPGYFLVRSQEGFEIIDEVDSPNVKLVFDIYHQQVSEGNLIPSMTGNVDKIGYLHAADHPGRHQPGTGEINLMNVLRAVDQAGYTGWVGLEYVPIGDPDESLVRIRSDFEEFSHDTHW